MKADSFLEHIIVNQFCSGCGSCAAVEESDFRMTLTGDGRYEPELKSLISYSDRDYTKICPFASIVDEDEIASDLYSGVQGVEHNPFEGFVLRRYAGHANDTFRAQGSSGGLTSWLLSKLLQENIVDSIVHVRSNTGAGKPLYNYAISSDVKELAEGSGSKYYPIQMADILQKVRDDGKVCAIVGIPCFIKAINLLQREDEELKRLIKVKVGLVCGHLKSEFFARSYAMELGINYDDITLINFREKLPGRLANNYGVKLKYETEQGTEEIVVPTKDLSTSNWGLGYFKYKACEYCDDVLAETADVTFGDAWLERYSKDYLGTNIIVIRNPIIQQIFDKYSDETVLEPISAVDVYQSQAGGFRHRREGLAYRLFLQKDTENYLPKKRVEPSDKLSGRRKRIYNYREILRVKSFQSFEAALAVGDFNVFNEQMDEYLKEYSKLNQRNIIFRILRKIFRRTKKLFATK